MSDFSRRCDKVSSVMYSFVWFGIVWILAMSIFAVFINGLMLLPRFAEAGPKHYLYRATDSLWHIGGFALGVWLMNALKADTLSEIVFIMALVCYSFLYFPFSILIKKYFLGTPYPSLRDFVE